MKASVIRLSAVLMLSGQLLPVGMPVLCDRSQQSMASNCEHYVGVGSSGPAIEVATTHATPCGNPAFCATMATAVVALSPTVSGSVAESRRVGFVVMTFVPVEPQPPLPPPPQA